MANGTGDDAEEDEDRRRMKTERIEEGGVKAIHARPFWKREFFVFDDVASNSSSCISQQSCRS